MGDVTVVLPFGGTCQHRHAARLWVQARYESWFGWDVDLIEMDPERPWCKPAAINRGVRQAEGSIVVIGDADCWSDGVEQAVAAVAAGAPWARPHHKVHRLTPSETLRVLAGHEPDVAMATHRSIYRGTGGGGILVATKQALLDVPADERFTGWGCEDAAYRDALRTLLGQEHSFGHPLFHLWHPPQRIDGKREASPENVALARRYSGALHDRAAMQALIAEATCQA